MRCRWKAPVRSPSRRLEMTEILGRTGVVGANRHRGQVAAEIGGARRVLRLTLGALAELEDAAGEDLAALLARVEAGRMSARDALRIIAAGLRGAGADAGLDAAEVAGLDWARLDIAGGPLGAFRLAADLIAAAFGGAETAPGNPPAPPGVPCHPDTERSPGGA